MARFAREMKTLAVLSHPNLLSIFDTGNEGGVAFAATELVNGATLRERLRQGALSWREAVGLAAALLAEGLAAAHARDARLFRAILE